MSSIRPELPNGAGKREEDRMKELRFSEQYIIRYGWGIDLGEIGDISLPEFIYWDEDEGVFTATVTYLYRGWTFSNCELFVKPEVSPDLWDKVEFADDVFDVYWGDWTISPTEQTTVLSVGDEKDLRGTNFERYGETK